MTIKCPKCQHENPDDMVFCGKCGTKFDSDIGPTKTIETPKEELTTGSTFAGRYQIIEELGKGGMGRVYKVLDKETKERIALKLIKPEIASDKKTIERFRNELTTARKISHRNVCRMYDLNKEKDSYYITMEYVPGEDLKSMIRMSKRMSVVSAIDIAKQVCDGLSEAHREEVIHRDLKPNNIMIDKKGNARIMDFGIARSLTEKGITGAGVMIGTPEYMSPEQVEAKEIDQRTDIYSLGVILYEMVTGRVPFEGDTVLSIAMKHKGEVPKDPKEYNDQIPDDLSKVILRCLEKEKDARYQSAGEVRSGLTSIEKGIPTTDRVIPERIPSTSKEITVTFRKRWLLIPIICVVLIAAVLAVLFLKKIKPVAPSMRQNMLVVLPFVNLGLPEDEYFADGITDEITSRLASLRELGVISRSSAIRYKKTEKTIREIGEELGVDFVLEGSVRWERSPKGKGRVRVTPQLIRVSDDTQLWSDRYDREIENIFDVQSDIAVKVIHQLDITLLESEKRTLKARPTDNLEAYQAYLRARELSRGLYPSQEEAETMVRLYMRAVELDPNFAQAWADLSRLHASLYYVGIDHTEKRLDEAKQALNRALEVDSELPAVIIAQGYYYYHGLEDYDRALEQFLIAAESLPNESMVSNAMGLVYRRLGKWEDAISAFEKAAQLDPKSHGPKSNHGNVLAAQKRFAEAEPMYEQALMIAPDVVDTYRWNAWNLLYWKGAIQEAREFLKHCPKQDHFYVLSTLAWCDYYDRNYEAVIAQMEARIFDRPRYEARRQLLLGCAYRQLNQQKSARRAFESVIEIQELQLEALPEGPESRNLDMIELALAYALILRKDEAIHMAQLGVDLNAHDAFEGPGWLALLAWVHIFSGDNEVALKIMEKLLETPNADSVPYAWSITAAVLGYHPDLDPLRDHLRFKDLMQRINLRE